MTALPTSRISDHLLACATCMGDAGDVTNKAAGYAIIFMLVMLAFVMAAIVKFMTYLAKKAKTPSIESR